MSSWPAILLRTCLLLLLATVAVAESPKLSGAQRQEIIRAFLDERAYAHRALPLGKVGMVIEGGRVSPSEAEVLQRGTAAQSGERVEITGVRFEHEGILFEINGGAVKHEKWSDRIHVGMGGPDFGPKPDEKNKNQLGTVEKEPAPKGAFVLLKLDNSAGITVERVRALLAPVLDFGSISQADAYQKNLSPVLAAAIKEHRALVGMDRDMVLEAMGRPPRRLRETAEGKEYEEWIYGSPPQDVQFIRFLRGKVVRIEQMKVTGEKQVRTQDEVGKVEGVLDASAPPIASSQKRADGSPASVSAPAMAAPTGVERRQPPTLLRPGEAAPASK